MIINIKLAQMIINNNVFFISVLQNAKKNLMLKVKETMRKM